VGRASAIRTAACGAQHAASISYGSGSPQGAARARARSSIATPFSMIGPRR